MLVAGLAAAMASISTAQEAEEPAETGAKPLEDINAVIKTNKGDLEIVLFPSKAPVTVASFLNLAKRDFYDGILFHRVVPGFVIQGGDPLTKDPGRKDKWGHGGPGYMIELEVNDSLKHHDAGVLSMARKPAPDSAGSQFFITLAQVPHLDGQYAVFGEVTEGVDIVKTIEVGDQIKDIEVIDSTDALFTKLERRIAEWNKQLDQRNQAEKAEKAAPESGAAAESKPE